MANAPKCTRVKKMSDLSGDGADVKALVNDIVNKLKGDYLVTKSGLAIGSTPANVANAALDYIINGVQYSKAAVAAGTALSGSAVPQNKYGAWRLEINASGTISIVAASGNATGYTSAALAIAGIAAVSADKASLGVVTAIKTDGAFTPGVTALNAANVTATYTDGQTHFEAISSVVA